MFTERVRVKGYNGFKRKCLLCSLPIINRMASAKYHEGCREGVDRLKTRVKKVKVENPQEWLNRQLKLLRREMTAFYTMHAF